MRRRDPGRAIPEDSAPLGDASIDGWDTSLLCGFTFGCRPDCALCCYASPAASRNELVAIRRVAPLLQIESLDGEFASLPSRPDGGACELLADCRCTIHSERPFPCRTFPLSTHLGPTAQTTVVLSCPGTDLRGLSGAGAGSSLDPSLTAELAATRDELSSESAVRRTRDGLRRWTTAIRRLEREGRWGNRSDLETELARDVDALVREGYPAWPPSSSSPLEELPVVFDPDFGRVVLSSDDGGIRRRVLRERGGIDRDLGSRVVPRTPRSLSPAARSLLTQYLRYHLRRNVVWGQIAVAIVESGESSLAAAARSEASWLVAAVVTRGAVLSESALDPGTSVDPAEIDRGIRATDAEALDRPSVGAIL